MKQLSANMHLRVTKQLIPRLRPRSVTSFRTIHVSRITLSADRPASGSTTGSSGTPSSAGATEGVQGGPNNTRSSTTTTSAAASEKPGSSSDPSHSHNVATPEEFPYSPKGPRRRSFRRRPPGSPPTTTTALPSSSTGHRQSAWWAVPGQASGSSSGGHSAGSNSIRQDTAAGYVPVIPDAFLQSHYTTSEAIRQDLASMAYHIHRGIKLEVAQTLASCLLAPRPSRTPLAKDIQRLPAKHNNLVLSSPIRGSSIMLETLTMAAAKEVGADVLAIDTQDIMELTADIGRGRQAASLWPTDHLLRGFNPYSLDALPTTHRNALLGLLAADDDDTIKDIMIKIRKEEDEDDDDEGFGDLDDYDDDDDDDIADDREYDRGRGRRYFIRDSWAPPDGSIAPSTSKTSSLKDKLTRFWTALLVATPPGTTTSATQDMAKPKILYLKEIADIVHTTAGSLLLPSLVDAVTTVREAGHNVMVVAGYSPSLYTIHDDDSTRPSESRTTTMSDMGAGAEGHEDSGQPRNGGILTVRQGVASSDIHSSDSTSDTIKVSTDSSLGKMYTQLLHGMEGLTLDRLPGPLPTFHHISIAPYMPMELSATQTEGETSIAQANWKLYAADRTKRIVHINVRNLQAVLRFRSGGGRRGTAKDDDAVMKAVQKVVMDREAALDVFGELKGIGREVWGFGKVYRLISMTLGSLYLGQKPGAWSMSANPLAEDHGGDPDHARIRQAVMAAMEIHHANTDLRQGLAKRAKQALAPKQENKLLIRPHDCTRHERRLLGCIVDPADTIQALQTMITLPLIRPDIFSHGLLKHEFLPGMLLFGPPGTGKTLLAKAVAKESGARMLEIKASDVFDMYVGEGEKNVAAIFSLARKLSPCVIFLDEVDSIFRARSSGGGFGASGGSHASQREILNQFMVEWDGLRSSGQNQGIVVMASTNRPFELDDAVLRRLPRRILVDLPDERARAQILDVYLRQEQLDPSVQVADLAKRTRLFSGSDLKNLCISAVLAAVRESVEEEAMKAEQQQQQQQQSQWVGTTTAQTPTLERVGLGDSPGQKTLNLAPLLEKYRREKKDHSASSNAPAAAARVLTKAHFDKAFQQITPSCSEDMSSLVELRKWDGLYGDGGRQRRKVLKTLGFDVEGGSDNSSNGRDRPGFGALETETKR
ncbi:hypothetical protein BGZ73_003325 [Actinomortierella ambigua]|nr:hypothetical protein BGZ73_003325 [Actinomortierella ambigua]